MQDLFAEAGLSSGAVYRYFASKDEVIMAIAEENTREVLAMMHAATARRPGRSAGAALADALEVILARDSRARSRVRGAPRGPRPVAVTGRIRRCYPRPDRLLPWRQ